ncbi:hypothetical protein SAMN04487939_108122 [Lysobacter sp. yr284]|uniref:DUF1993 domain-containing protein n=1 Tax=Lysobacter sp. yr284 TaxID=1761791 RepID=UPI0008963726|nr:DUF1993 domain-containing protein [Lysobacter sp. yr284]SDY91119.1 hypothetical protein SAMN04487939_108122 [Lysobacter sp. yr284]
MTVSMYSASVPVLQQLLGSLSTILERTQAQAAERKIDADAYLQARLFPDMFPLLRQVQIACDFAKGIGARLADVAVPVYDDSERSFDELQALIAKTRAFLDGLEPALFEGADDREIVLRPGTPKERRFNGRDYLVHYGLPQFFFHATTAYAILRNNGVEIGKRDFMGQY